MGIFIPYNIKKYRKFISITNNLSGKQCIRHQFSIHNQLQMESSVLDINLVYTIVYQTSIQYTQQCIRHQFSIHNSVLDINLVYTINYRWKVVYQTSIQYTQSITDGKQCIRHQFSIHNQLQMYFQGCIHNNVICNIHVYSFEPHFKQYYNLQ